ncbi:MAG: LamG domain-containing protein, partial [Candidatus Sumerlaeota bacterium]|nr:LamG domain-containing protein [Candidatus Sumerlaeota bacterium]
MVKKLIIWLAVAAIIGPASWALGDTINWPFTTAGNYTVSDATKVDVADGVAKLIVVDQTDDDNTSTGFGWGTHNQTQWDNGNSWLELQAGQASGNFISRVMDAGALAVWNSISWTPERPLYKELPDNKGIETAYPTGNADMTGNVLLMHMNEASGTIVDYSGEGNNGTQNGGVTYGASGKLNTALNFDGTNDYVNCGAGLASKTYPLTFEAWVKPNILAQAGIILNFDVTDPNSDIAFGIYNTTNKILIGKSTYQVGLNGISTYLTAGQWSHWVVVFTDTTHITFYLDGTQKTLVNVADYYTVAGSVTSIGSRTNGRYFNGTIDEVAIYNRALTAVEIADHYKRGVLRLRYQVRSGSTNPPTGNFIGPDGTTGTYYSELSNSTTGLPSLNLTNVDNNQFFQYMAYFETDNSSYSPELKSVVIGPTHYPGDNPTVRNNTGQSYGTLTSFIETLGAGNVGSVKYQISNDGTNWYYWNGFNWVAGSGYSQSNTVAEVNTNCGQFDDDVGTGDFYFKAFLHSDAAAQQVELDQVDLGYTYTITASAGANGSISPSGAVTVNYGADQGFTITPIAHYHVADVLVDSVSVGAVTSYTFLSVTTNHTIAASFAFDTYTITASAGANGSISPSGAVTVNYGADQGFTITPIAHYHIADVLVDSVSVGA